MNVWRVTFRGYLAKILSFKSGNLLYKSNFYLLSCFGCTRCGPSDIDCKRLGLDDVNYSREQYYKYIFIANTLDACMFRFTMYSLENYQTNPFVRKNSNITLTVNSLHPKIPNILLSFLIPFFINSTKIRNGV